MSQDKDIKRPADAEAENIAVEPTIEAATAPSIESSVSRRRFLGSALGIAAGVAGAPLLGQSALSSRAFGPFIARAAEPGQQKLNVIFVGTGGRAEGHLGLADSENCIAYCDVDSSRFGKIKEKAPKADAFTDWRNMMDKHLAKADVVVVAVPDHSHALPSLRAIHAGKNVYTEKPLTWSIEEARALATAARQKKVATQMGNQGHANNGNRLVVEWIRGGVIGDVVEVHTWTNRPIWPQGNLQRELEPLPATLNWDAWIGPAPMRPFQKHLHSFEWRGWFDFGCGAVGDMGCHTWDQVFWAMNPDYPTEVELLEIDEKGTETFPKRSHFRWTFPAKDKRPGFVAHWYSGGMKPPIPEEMLNDPTRKKADGSPPTLPDSATMWIGTKGKMLVSGDYAEGGPRLIPEARMQEVAKAKGLPPQTIPRSPGHMEEFIMASKKQKPWNFPGSNFAEYSGPLTEVMLLGAITEKIGQVGFKIECDAVKREIKTKEAKAFRQREYRKGWDLHQV